jgi:hypothetical protein
MNREHHLARRWGPEPGQSFVRVHLNRLLKKDDPEIEDGKWTP